MPSQSGSTNVHVLAVITVVLLLAGARPQKWHDWAMGDTAAENSKLSNHGDQLGDVSPAAANASNISARPTCVYSYFYTPADSHGMVPAHGGLAPAAHRQPYVSQCTAWYSCTAACPSTDCHPRRHAQIHNMPIICTCSKPTASQPRCP